MYIRFYIYIYQFMIRHKLNNEYFQITFPHTNKVFTVSMLEQTLRFHLGLLSRKTPKEVPECPRRTSHQSKRQHEGVDISAAEVIDSNPRAICFNLI